MEFVFAWFGIKWLRVGFRDVLMVWMVVLNDF